MRRVLREQLRCLLSVSLILALATTSLAWPPGGNGGGNGGGGGGEDPPPPELPPIEYQVSATIALPFTGGHYLWDMNESGGAAGSTYVDGGGQRAWIYEPGYSLAAFDPNDLGLPGIDPDDPGQWTMVSAIGINNNGLVVGRMLSNDGSDWSRGYVLDLAAVPPQIYDLPDLDWDYSLARRVNDNGDILGLVREVNGDRYHYMFSLDSLTNPDPQLEVIGELYEFNPVSEDITNPPPGTPASMVGLSAGNPDSEYVSAYVYTQGGSITWIDGFRVEAATISSNGIVAGWGYFATAGKGKKINWEKRLFRDTFGVLDTSAVYWPGVNAVNADGTILFQSGTENPTKGLWHAEYGLIAVDSLIPGGLPAELIVKTQNDSGVLGYSELGGIADDNLVFLTPVSTAP